VAGVGTHTITYTYSDANGCSNTISRNIIVNALPSGSAGSDVSLCSGQSTVLSANGGTSYQWSNGAISSSIAVTPSGNTVYTVRIFNASGCFITDTVTVFVNQPAPINVTGNRTICSGGSTILTATGSISYLWTPSIGLSANNIANPTVSPQVTTTYTVYGTDALGCVSSTLVQVIVLPRPTTVNAGSDQTFCGNPVTLSGTGAINYEWINLTTGQSLGTSSSIQVSPNQATQYRLIGQDIFGCSADDTVNVYVPNASAGTTRIICLGDSIQLTGVLFGANPNTPLSYSWSTSNANAGLGASSSVVNPFVRPTTSGNYIYQLNITSGGCTFYSSVSVIVLPKPAVDLGPDRIIAPGNSLTINPTMSGIVSGSTYQWIYTQGNTLGSISANNTAQITFTANSNIGTSAQVVQLILAVINPNGCQSSDTLQITLDPNLAGITISGQLVYDNFSNSPISQGAVYLGYPNGRIDSSTVSSSGSFVFTGILDSTYALYSRVTSPWGGITVTDAALINTHVTTPILTGIKERAADVDGNGMVLSNDAQQTALRAAELPIFNSFDNGTGPGNWVHDTNSVVVTGQNLQIQTKALSYGDVDGSYSPVVRSQNSLVHRSDGYLTIPSDQIVHVPVTVNQSSNIGSFQMDLKLNQGDQIMSIHNNKFGNPILYKQTGNIVRILWYSQNNQGHDLKSGEELLTIRIQKSINAHNSDAFELIGYNEINNALVQPYSNFEIITPRLIRSSDPNAPQVSAYPNPVQQGKLFLNFKSINQAEIQISDINGRILWQENLDIQNNQSRTIDVSDWAAGQYSMQVIAVHSNGSQNVYRQTISVRH
jgi:hypothetical protein